MLKKIIFLSALINLVLISHPNIAYSQPVTWVKIIGDSVKNMAGISIVQTYDGGYAVLGYKQFTTGNEKMLLLKLDYLGNLLWLKYPADTIINVSPLKLVQVKDSGLVMFGYDHTILRNFLLKTDKSGNFLWRKNYPDTAIDARFSDFTKT